MENLQPAACNWQLDLSLYVITTDIPDLGRGHLEIARAAIAGGASIIQFREKQEKEAKKIFEEALRVREVSEQAKIPFIVNDRLDIALATEADGVHLGSEDLPVWRGREILGKNKIVGASVDNPAEAIKASAEGADYLGVGPIFVTPSKSEAGEPIGLETLRKIRAAVKIPVVAIGGINLDNVTEVLEAGAHGVAVISAIADAPNMKEATRTLLKKIRLAQGGV